MCKKTMGVYTRIFLLLVLIACIQVGRACNRNSITCYHCDSVASPDSCDHLNFNSSLHMFDTVSASWDDNENKKSCVEGNCRSGLNTYYYCRKLANDHHDDGIVGDLIYCNHNLCNQGNILSGVSSYVLYLSIFFTFYGQ